MIYIRLAFFSKKGSYAETYRVQNGTKETKFLKLFDYAKLHRTQFTDDGDILEIEVLKQIKHPNLGKYNDNGNIIIDNQKYAYVVLDFISGETLADKMKRENTLNACVIKKIRSLSRHFARKNFGSLFVCDKLLSFSYR